MKNRLKWMIRDDEGLPDNKIPRKRARLQNDNRYDIVDTRQPMRFKWGLITVENNTWKILQKKKKNFRVINRKFICKETTCELQIPSNFKEVMDQKSPGK